MKAKKLPDQTFLRECLDYDPETGCLTWRERPLRHFVSKERCLRWNRKKVGLDATVLATPRYPRRYIWIDKSQYMAHRIIWKWMTDEDPVEIDHRDKNSLNNRWSNLRNATRAQNTQNRDRGKRDLPKGVYRTRQKNRWVAHVAVGGKIYHIGTYGSPKEAHAAYRKSAIRLHGEFASFGHVEPPA